MRGPAIEIRILSGQNVGAALELVPGRYVIGRGDSCDLIMADSGIVERHLALVVLNDDDQPSVTIRPLDGQVQIDGQRFSSDGSVILPPGVRLMMGFTALAWQLPGSQWEHFDFREAAADAHEPQQPSEDIQGEVEEDISEGIPVSSPQQQEASVQTGDDEDKADEKISSGRQGWFLRTAVLALVLLILVFAPSLDRLLSRHTDYLDYLRDLLADKGFALTVENSPEGILISGSLQDDQALGELVRLVETQRERVYLAVEVEDDLVRAVRGLLVAQGFYPDVRRLDGDLTISVYMLDGLVEARIFDYVQQDLPRLDQAKWRVVYAAQAQLILTDEFKKAGLPQIDLHFGPGWIQWTGELDLQGRAKLRQAIMRAERRLKVPLDLRMFADHNEEMPRKYAGDDSSVVFDVANDSVWGDLKIMGVNLGPMKFITAHDGRKFFKGGVLPSGYTITGIDSTTITLTRGEETIVYNLDTNEQGM